MTDYSKRIPAAIAKGKELTASASPEPWTTDDVGQETQYVYGTIVRDRSIGYGIFARSIDNTYPRIAWVHAADHKMVEQSRSNAQLITLGPDAVALAEALWEATQDTPNYLVGGEQIPEALIAYCEKIEKLKL